MQSNVSDSQVVNDGDQRREDEQANAPLRFEAGQPNSHLLFDSKDEQSLGNRRDAELKAERDEALRDKEAVSQDPRAPAGYGNEPSRGAQIDAELKAEDEEILRKKGVA